MTEKRSFKQNFIRSAVISSAIGITAYSIITSVPWGILGLELGGGPKPDAAIEDAARAAAVTETVMIGGKIWMKRNLNVWSNGSWCYENNPDNCEKYGRLYTWYAAKRTCAGLGDGWRLPTVYDWEALINAVGGASIAAPKLKTQTGWSPDSTVCTDEFGFSALPGGETRYNSRRKTLSLGLYDPIFSDAGVSAGFWSATEMFWGYADQVPSMYIGPELIGMAKSDKTDGYSVRCVKD